MTKRYPFEIQVVNRAFSGKIPEHMWRTVGYANHPVTALRRFEKESRAVHPQLGSWSGHVRVLCGGKPVMIDDHGNIVRGYDHATGDEYPIDWRNV